MATSKRIAVNTLATYGRSLVCMVLGLFSSRWVLQAFGPIDYGLMAVVGALIAIIFFVNAAISSSSARYFAFSIGKGDAHETNAWFNSSLFLHLALVPILLLALWLLGEWALRGFLNIPEARMETAQWVFRLSLIAAFWGMGVSPYIDMFIAKQNIVEMSIWGVLTSLLNFLLAYGVTCYGGDRWLLYCVGTVAFSVTLLSVQVFRATALYEECRIDRRLWFDRGRIVELLKYSGSALFGAIGDLFRGQGITVLLNSQFNPARFPQVNASFAIGNTLSHYTQTFSAGLMNAFTPEITATEGRGERSKMLQHAFRASKFATYLTLLFAIPLLLEMEYVLDLWLNEPPRLAAPMATLILISFIIDRLTVGQTIAVNAKGKVAGYHFTIGGLMILTLPIAWFFLFLGFDAISVCWAYLLTVLLSLFGKLYWAQRMVGLSAITWLREVLLPCCLVLAVGLFLGGLMQQCFAQPSFVRLCAIVVTSLISSASIGWLTVLGVPERAYCWSSLARIRKQLCG